MAEPIFQPLQDDSQPPTTVRNVVPLRPAGRGASAPRAAATELADIVGLRQAFAETRIPQIQERLQTLLRRLLDVKTLAQGLAASDPRAAPDLAPIEAAIETLRAESVHGLGLLERLKRRCSRGAVSLWIVGPSGAGKSALVCSAVGREGLVPSQSGRSVTGVSCWIVHDPDVAEPEAEVEFRADDAGLDERHYAEYGPFLGQPPRTVGLDALQPFVAQVDGGGQPTHRYLAVRKVTIRVPYPHPDHRLFSFVDTRGRNEAGDDAPGPPSALLAEEADVLVLLFRPDPIRAADVDPADLRVPGAAEGATAFVVLNRLDPPLDNLISCDLIRDSVRRAAVPDEHILTADCTDPEEVRAAVLSPLAARLLAEQERCPFPDVPALDLPHVREVDALLTSTLPRLLDAVLQAAKRAPVPSAGEADAFALVTQRLYPALWGDLHEGLTRLLRELAGLRGAPCVDLDRALAAALAACRVGAIVPAPAAIERRWHTPEARSQFALVYYLEALDLRQRLSDAFEAVDPVLRELIDAWKARLAAILRDQGGLGALTEEPGAAFFAEAARLLGADYPELDGALRQVARFDVSVRAPILSHILRPLERLYPDRLAEDLPKPLAEDEAPAVIHDHLALLHRGAVADVERALGHGLPDPHELLFAAVRQFTSQLLDGAKDELQRLCFERRGAIWAAELAEVEARAGLRERWRAAIQHVTEAARPATAGCLPH